MCKKYFLVLFSVMGIAAFLLCAGSRSAIPNNEDFKANDINTIPNFRKINSNINAGGRPGEQGVKQLAQMGIRTIVDLETGIFTKEPEVVKREEKEAQELGIMFQKVPMHSFMIPSKEKVGEAVDLIADSNNQPVFIHCEHGKDRTGIVIAIYRMKIDGWPAERAYKEMKKNGFHWYLFWWKRRIFEYINRSKERTK